MLFFKSCRNICDKISMDQIIIMLPILWVLKFSQLGNNIRLLSAGKKRGRKEKW